MGAQPGENGWACDRSGLTPAQLKVSTRKIMARLEGMARTRPVGTVRGDRSVLVILRDEYLTSQVCPTCHQRTKEKATVVL